MELSIGIVTLNARYVHTSLSLRYLRNAARNAGYGNVWIEEFVINRPTWKIAAAIQKRKPDVLGLSVYIWNRTQSFELIELLKKQSP
ncbi:MAG: cobalamin B12-binding domain-containing protein, partial [Nitrospinae bacterium]|nr:cobalamin B12-binding domain-containing protein [Nitrospinota bacterium]